MRLLRTEAATLCCMLALVLACHVAAFTPGAVFGSNVCVSGACGSFHRSGMSDSSLHGVLCWKPLHRLAKVFMATHSDSEMHRPNDEVISEESMVEVIDEEVPLLYEGPVGKRQEMETGFVVEELGLTVMVGPSRAAPGRGLFVCLADGEGIERVELPAGSLFSGYCKDGVWEESARGDKAVAYAFEDPDTAVLTRPPQVVCEKELKPLIEAVATAEGVTENINKGLVGHSIFCDETDTLRVAPDVDWGRGRYFVPRVVSNHVDITPANLGMFANDLAFFRGCTDTAEAYEQAAAENDVLQLVWRLAEEGGMLVPTWPLVFMKRRVAFTNRQPMELGISYGFQYWKGVMDAETPQ